MYPVKQKAMQVKVCAAEKFTGQKFIEGTVGKDTEVTGVVKCYRFVPMLGRRGQNFAVNQRGQFTG